MSDDQPIAKRPIGRPAKQFDLEVVEGLAALQATDAEIASVLGCSKSTLSAHKARDASFRTAIKRGREHGKASLRRLQWRAAQAGNITMMIWLGKNWLAQTDRAKVEHEFKAPILEAPKSAQEAREILEAEGVTVR
jgi:hypothetical protein